ncbi:TRAP transporter substrate-binding protein [Undibacterium sp.]|uniref:TRAP transporter substrate-binding protein n=1 Tax=Undibacterium sp. TaxID=1914977 RepID=UPI00374D4180
MKSALRQAALAVLRCVLAPIAFLLVVAPILVLPTVQAQEVRLRVATAYGAENFHTRNLQQFADDLAQATAGKLRLEIYAAGSLLKPQAIFSGVQQGSAEAGEVIMSSLEKEISLFGLDSLPFIVGSYDDAQRLWEVSRSGVQKALEQRGLQLLYAVPWPPQNLYARKPVNTMQDFKGLRMRSYNPASERIAELIWATPVPVQAVELERAIAADKIDLMLTSSGTGVESRAWSRLSYYYRTSAWIPKNVVFISKQTLAGMDAETRRKLMLAADAAEKRGWRLSRESDAGFEAQLLANKMQIAVLDPLVRRYLDRIGENLAREWLKKAGNEELMVLLKYTSARPAR